VRRHEATVSDTRVHLKQITGAQCSEKVVGGNRAVDHKEPFPNALTPTFTASGGMADSDKLGVCPMPERIYTPQEVCDVLHISRKTLQRMTDARKISFFRVGGGLRFRESALLLFINSHEKKAKLASPCGRAA